MQMDGGLAQEDNCTMSIGSVQYGMKRVSGDQYCQQEVLNDTLNASELLYNRPFKQNRIGPK